MLLAATGSTRTENKTFKISISTRCTRLPRPQLAVEAAVADGLDDVAGLQVGRPFQVGDGAGHAQDAVVRPRRQPQFVHGRLQQRLALRVEGAVAAQLPR